MILPANKGRATVVVDKDYENKVSTMKEIIKSINKFSLILQPSIYKSKIISFHPDKTC